jgi:hypothetical protein
MQVQAQMNLMGKSMNGCAMAISRTREKDSEGMSECEWSECKMKPKLVLRSNFGLKIYFANQHPCGTQEYEIVLYPMKKQYPIKQQL